MPSPARGTGLTLLDFRRTSLAELSRIDGSASRHLVDRLLWELDQPGRDLWNDPADPRCEPERRFSPPTALEEIVPLLKGLPAGELDDLAAHRLSAKTVGRLKDIEQGKHRLLLGCLVRAREDESFRLLCEVERRAPEAVRHVLASPQFGVWAINTLRAEDMPGLDGLAPFAASAALTAGVSFELQVPYADGELVLPCVARVKAPSGGSGRATVVGAPSDATVRWPTGESSPRSDWAAARTVTLTAAGISLRLLVEDRLLDCYAAPLAPDDDQCAWEDALARAWRLIAVHHRPLADAMASLLTTLVPLARSSVGCTTSASSASAFGAVAIALPADEWLLAERLVHEFQHVLLGAVMDVVTLADPVSPWRGYAPWRQDPRPAVGLLQGAFAYFGVTGFWREHCGDDDRTVRARAQREYVRWHEACVSATDTLIHASALSPAGASFVRLMRETLRSWPLEPVSASVAGHARTTNLAHHLRWRLSNLCPDPQAIVALAADWQRGRGPTTPVTSVEVSLRSDSEHPKPTSIEFWVSSALVGGRTLPKESVRLLRDRIEVVAAVQEQIRDLTGSAPGAASLTGWLTPPVL